MNADEAFKELTRRTGVLLRQHAFKGSGQNFKRDCGEQWQGINFQKSQWRVERSDPIDFYLNIHAYFPNVQCKRFKAADCFDDYSHARSDLQLRASDLIADQNDSWLTVSGPLPRLDNFCQRFMSLLTDTILPAMDTMRTPEGLERTLRRVPWMCMSANRWLLQHGRGIHPWDPGEAADWSQDADSLWWHSSERAAP